MGFTLCDISKAQQTMVSSFYYEETEAQGGWLSHKRTLGLTFETMVYISSPLRLLRRNSFCSLTVICFTCVNHFLCACFSFLQIVQIWNLKLDFLPFFTLWKKQRKYKGVIVSMAHKSCGNCPSLFKKHYIGNPGRSLDSGHDNVGWGSAILRFY